MMHTFYMPADASDASHHSLTGLEKKFRIKVGVLTFRPFFCLRIHRDIMSDDYGEEDSDYGESEMGGEVGVVGAVAGMIHSDAYHHAGH
jgi:hypothetical protein